MPNLSVSVTRNGNDVTVSGTALMSGTVTVGGQTQTLTPDATGHYSVTFTGVGAGALTVGVNAGPKDATVEVDEEIDEFTAELTVLTLGEVKVKRNGTDEVKLSGKFRDGTTPPGKVVCTRVATGEEQSAAVDPNSRKWDVTFVKCPGKNHRFRTK